MKVNVILFRAGGKYYTEEQWTVPADAIGPYDMERSPDFRRIENGPVLIDTQEPWGYPHLFPAKESVPEPVESFTGELVSAPSVLEQLAQAVLDGRVSLVPGPNVPGSWIIEVAS